MTSLPGHFRSREVISCDITATTCKLQPCRSSNVHRTWLIRLLQPLPGDFRSNDVTSGDGGPREVISCHVCATSCELQLCRSSNEPKTCLIGILEPLSGNFRSNHVTSGSLTVTWRHFLSRDCHLLQVTALQELKRTWNLDYRPSTATSRRHPVKWRHFRVTSGHVGSREVISCHVNATSCEW